MKRRRNVKPEDQYGFITKHARNTAGAVLVGTTQHGVVDVTLKNGDVQIGGMFVNDEEAFQLFRALTRAGAVQFGSAWHERCQNYLSTVHIVKEPS